MLDLYSWHLKKKEQIKDQILIGLQICRVKFFIPNYRLEKK